MARAAHNANDYGTAPQPTRSSKMHRPLIAANHALHLISSIIVMSIAAYFIGNYRHNTHLVYWLSLAAIDALIFLLGLALLFRKRYNGYYAPLHHILSYLWLTAFIFAAQDFNNCTINSPLMPFGTSQCSLKRTLEAFAFLAFLTNLIGTWLETRLWDLNRRPSVPFAEAAKHHDGGIPVTAAPHTAAV